jgi:hypothetical protein
MTARLTRRLTLPSRYTIRASGKELGDGRMERGRPPSDVIATALWPRAMEEHGAISSYLLPSRRKRPPCRGGTGTCTDTGVSFRFDVWGEGVIVKQRLDSGMPESSPSLEVLSPDPDLRLEPPNGRGKRPAMTVPFAEQAVSSDLQSLVHYDDWAIR